MQLASFALLSLAFVQEPELDLSGQLQSIARGAVADAGLRGVSVHIAMRDGVLLSRGPGYIDGVGKRIQSPLAARDGEALVEPLAFTGLLAQVEAGKLSLEAPPTNVLAKLVFGGQRVLVLHLVEQASGIADWSVWLAVRGEPATAADVLAWLAQRTPDADPGTYMADSASNVVVAGALPERAVGDPLAD